MKLRLAASLLLAASIATGELVRTRDGRAFVGEVIALTPTHLDMEVDYPAPGKRRIERNALTDRTVWRIRSGRLDLEDSEAWFALGEWARKRDMHTPALVAYRKASRDESLAAKAEPRIAAMEAKLAQDLFDRGEVHFVNDRPASAKNYFDTLLERYPDAPCAPMARTRLEQVKERISEKRAGEEAMEEASEKDEEIAKEVDRWKDDVERVRSLLRLAARQKPARLDATKPVKTSRALEEASATLQGARRLARDLERPPEGVPADAGRKLRRTIRKRLVEASVDTGYAYLMRPALNSAEEYASKATELDPGNEDARALHRTIIEARLMDDFEGFYPRRGFSRRRAMR